MPTLIDSLMIEFGMDPTKFTSGQKSVLEGLGRLEKDYQKTHLGLQDATNKTIQAVTVLYRSMNAFFALIALKKIAQFTQDISKTTAAIGWHAANLGVANKSLEAWGLLAERYQSDAQSGMNSVDELQKKIFLMQNREPGSIGLGMWQGLSAAGLSDQFLGEKDPSKQMEVLVQAVENIQRQRSRQDAYNFGIDFGMDKGVLNSTLDRGAAATLKELKEARDTLTASSEQIEEAKRLHKAWAEIAEQMTRLSRLVLTFAEGPLIGIIKRLTAFMEALSGKSIADIQKDFNAPGPYDEDSGGGGGGGDGSGGGVGAGDRPVGSSGSEGSPPAEKAAEKEAEPSWFGARWYRDAKKWWNGDKATAPTGATGGGSGSPAAATGSLGSLAADRKRFAAELAANPSLRERALAISLNEQGSDTKGNTSIFETAMNRASLYKKSLASQLTWKSEGNGYYDDRRDLHSRALRALQDPKTRAWAEANLNNALGGSNYAKFGTDNASGSWGWNRMDGMFGLDASHGGEYFGHPVRSDAAGYRTYPAWRAQFTQPAPNGQSPAYTPKSLDFSNEEGWVRNSAGGWEYSNKPRSKDQSRLINEKDQSRLTADEPNPVNQWFRTTRLGHLWYGNGSEGAHYFNAPPSHGANVARARSFIQRRKINNHSKTVIHHAEIPTNAEHAHEMMDGVHGWLHDRMHRKQNQPSTQNGPV